MVSNINSNVINNNSSLTINKNLKQEKYGVFVAGKEIREPAFDLVEQNFNSILGVLNSKQPIEKQQASTIIDSLSNSEEGLKAIQLNLPTLSQNDLLEAYEGVKVFDKCFKKIAKKIDKAKDQIFNLNPSESLVEQVQIMTSQQKIINKIKTQILCSQLIKNVHVEKIQASLENTKNQYVSWIRNMILIFPLIKKLIQYFFGGNESISKESDLDQLFKKCQDSLQSLETAEFYLGTTEKELGTLKEFVEEAEKNLKEFNQKLENIQEQTNHQSSLKGKLSELQEELETLKKNLNNFQNLGFNRSQQDKALNIFTTTKDNQQINPEELEKRAIAIITLLEEAIDRGESLENKDVEHAINWAKNIIDKKINKKEEAQKDNSSIMPEDEFTLFSLCLEGAQEILQFLNKGSPSPVTSEKIQPPPLEEPPLESTQQNEIKLQIENLLKSITDFLVGERSERDLIMIKDNKKMIKSFEEKISQKDFPLEYERLKNAKTLLNSLKRDISNDQSKDENNQNDVYDDCYY